MAKRSAAMPPDAKHARILLSVLVGHGTFSELREIELTRRPLPPDALADLLDAAVFETIIFDELTGCCPSPTSAASPAPCAAPSRCGIAPAPGKPARCLR